MDESHFDDLTRSFVLPSRRSILSALGVALLGTLLGPDAADETLAKRTHGRKKGHINHPDRAWAAGQKGKNGKAKAQSKGKQKVTICHNGQTIQVAESALKGHRKHGDSDGPCPPASCSPESPAETCAGRCGTVTNTCGSPVDCGPCNCNPLCTVCQICNTVTGACEPDAQTVGDPCGDPGQICQANGVCSCDDTSCGGVSIGACEEAYCTNGGTCGIRAQENCVICNPKDCATCQRCGGNGACEDVNATVAEFVPAPCTTSQDVSGTCCGGKCCPRGITFTGTTPNGTTREYTCQCVNWFPGTENELLCHRSSPGPCRTDGDCFEEQQCGGGECYDDRQCATDGDCPGNAVCTLGGWCITPCPVT